MGYKPIPTLEERWLPHTAEARGKGNQDMQRRQGVINCSDERRWPRLVRRFAGKQIALYDFAIPLIEARPAEEVM